MEDDLNLWKKIRNGDTASLKKLHDRYYYQLYIYAKRIYPYQQGLDEAVSDCFIRLWNKRESILIEYSVKSYLFLILHHILIDLARRKKRIILLENNKLPETPDLKYLEDLEDYARLYRALDKLPEQRRRILDLAVFESMTYDQIADKLRISKNTVKTQIGRSYQFLREELDPKAILLLFQLKSC